jgi:hypothetical protein
MQFAHACVAALLCLAPVGSTFAQQTAGTPAQGSQQTSPTNQSPQRDPQAVSAIQNALFAMGKVPGDSKATGTITLVEGSTTQGLAESPS